MLSVILAKKIRGHIETVSWANPGAGGGSGENGPDFKLPVI